MLNFFLCTSSFFFLGNGFELARALLLSSRLCDTSRSLDCSVGESSFLLKTWSLLSLYYYLVNHSAFHHEHLSLKVEVERTREIHTFCRL
jgi:hypothetical protein